ncbi:hypothetical protein M153_3200007659 [Pseudoloma neurophilia]|uniref:Uncharacterized protein n=1 Tax=Pseudoloma neurophilia TaxID=146866 RepID=A0A0R0LY40_9MICR|nr:hypothetical protein M153_3200007659 [Pseudoloma neurophilia]
MFFDYTFVVKEHLLAQRNHSQIRYFLCLVGLECSSDITMIDLVLFILAAELHLTVDNIFRFMCEIFDFLFEPDSTVVSVIYSKTRGLIISRRTFIDSESLKLQATNDQAYILRLETIILQIFNRYIKIGFELFYQHEIDYMNLRKIRSRGSNINTQTMPINPIQPEYVIETEVISNIDENLVITYDLDGFALFVRPKNLDIITGRSQLEFRDR